MRYVFRPALAVAAFALAGCASLPAGRGYAESGALVSDRLGVAPDAAATPPTVPIEIPSTPLTAADAVRLAFLHSPRVREASARLGLGLAELEDARRLPNPSFGYAKLDPRTGEGTQIARGLSWSIGDLFLLPARKRFASGELDRLQKSVAAEWIALASDVETAWYDAVAAAQVAAMRDLVAQAAESSATLAQRFFDAGNINRLQLEQELAAASQARIDTVRASADALRARSALGGKLGLTSQASWRTLDQLPEPPATLFSADALVGTALEQRLDLAAAQQRVVLLEDTLGVTRRWRWLGSVEAGYERENELDGGVMRGPSLSLELPIFNQGQGAIARAQAELLDARAQLDGLALTVQNDARLGVEQVAIAHDIAQRYRDTLVPRREAIVARTQERVNYMLQGVFELIAAKQQEYDAYQEYLEAVRDYWTARAQLRAVVGGRLPDDGALPPPTLGVEAVLPSAPAPMDHSMHGQPAGDVDPHAGHQMPEQAAPAPAGPHAGHAMPAPATDTHAGHAMPESKTVEEVTSDPHAGHDMPAPPATPDPHAGHAMPVPETPPTPDPHAGHAMPAPAPAAQDAHDPHAGHRMPQDAATSPTAEPTDTTDASDDDAHADHDHGDTP